MRRPIRHGLLSVAVLAGGAWVLIGLGSRLPWLRIDWSDPVTWLTRAEADQALAALARLTGLALIGWVGITSLIYMVARLAGVRPGSIRWLSVGPIRRAVDTLLAGSLLLGTVAPSLPAGAGIVEPTTASTPAETVLPGYIPLPAGEVYPLPTPTTTEPTPTGQPTHSVTEPPPLATTNPPPPHVIQEADEKPAIVEVRPGDNLWELAARHLERSGQRAKAAKDIVLYWRMVVEANQNRIRSGDPDLIYPGEKIVLPPVSPES